MAKQRVTEHDREVRNQKAMELHLAGASYRTIAEQLGISLAVAHDAVKAGLAARTASDGEAPAPAGMSDTIDVELARLDAMLMGLWPAARRGNVQAVDRVLKIGERRTALLSLRGPVTNPVAPAGEEPVGLLDELKAKRDAKRAGDV